MLLEALRHALIRCPPPLKAMGVLYDLLALESRYRRCRAAWEPHLQQARDGMLDLLGSPTGGGCVAVLGSGLLLDIPLDELCRRFDRVVLVDLFHMPAVRRRCASLPGVELVETDLTGVMAHWGAVQSGQELPVPVPVLPQADAVISANILSQLSFRLAGHAFATGLWTPDALSRWECALKQAHVDALSRHQGGPAILLTDHTRILRSVVSGEDLTRSPLLSGVILPEAVCQRTWAWTIAPAPEESRRHDVVHQVCIGRVDAAPPPPVQDSGVAASVQTR
ncbi:MULTISPECIES: hypothetical protein [unclassified Haematospirillum]|uniref:hypothetical protein n=1 Tax=unclassified Haematospirillum TaxID=2622088 RepID=UPI00143B07C8|nr:MULTISPECIES: hypothetical protein [unclassified Haematospirillum]NKD55237.1 hypothetical protein [Haematospirillum sp. H4890]NKD75122.1 hypothetical protein [Haematospirillum sp. H4485]